MDGTTRSHIIVVRMAALKEPYIRDATFLLKPIAGTAPHHHQAANNYRQIPADYGSLQANCLHLYRRFTDEVGLFTTDYRR